MWGQLLSKVIGKSAAATVGGWTAKGAGAVGAGALKGALKGAIPGAALWDITGNSDWMWMGMGAGALRGGAKGALIGASPVKNPKFGRKIANYMAGGKMMRNLAIGTGIGMYQDDPNWAAFGAIGIPIAKWGAKTFYSPKGGLGMLKGAIQAPFSPTRAGATLAKVSGMEAWASAGFIGLMAGGASSAYNTYSRAASGYEPRDNSVTSGYFPGGTMTLGQGRKPGIGNNHLSSEGLTLALHNNASRTRVI